MMRSRIAVFLLVVFGLVVPSLVGAQDNEPTATTTQNAPVFASTNDREEPLRIAQEGSVLLLLEEEGEWCRVEYQDPELGRRVGYVQRRLLRIDRASTKSQTSAGRPRQAAVATVSSPSAEPTKSVSSGFFVGAGLEGAGLAPNTNGINLSTDSGAGAGLVIGYGFNPRWSLYGTLSGANMSASSFSGSYGLGHFDLGTRVHFRTGPNTVVPFLQFGVSGRAASQSYLAGSRQYDVTVSGAGVEFGGGLNVHFSPRFAFSGGVTWMVGNFSTYTINNVAYSGPTVSDTSARIHLGLIWFPGGSQKSKPQPASGMSVAAR
jgi:hypothetical protein